MNASCLGALLVQPQRLGRLSASTTMDSLANDVLRLVGRLAGDLTVTAGALRVIGDTFEDAALRFYTHAQPGLARAEQRLRAVLDGMTAADVHVELPDGVDGGTQLVQRLLERLSVAVRLDADGLRPHAQLLVDVIENELGLSAQFVTDQIWALVDDLIARFGSLPPDLNHDAKRLWIEIRSVLRRVRRRLQAEFSFPGIRVDDVVEALLKLLRGSPLPAIAQQASCLSAELAKGVASAGKLLSLVPMTGFASGSIGAAAAAPSVEAQYCWYASWLLATKKRPEWWQFGRMGRIFADRFGDAFSEWDWWEYIVLPVPEALGSSFYDLMRSDDVWVDKEHKRVLWGDHVLYKGTDVTWEDALRYDRSGARSIRKHADRTEPRSESTDDVLFSYHGYTFGQTFLGVELTPDAMEAFARHSAWIRDYFVAGLHLLPSFSLRQGDYLANTLNAGVLAVEGTFKLATKAPVGWWMDNVSELPQHVGDVPAGFVSGFFGTTPWTLSVLATVGGSLEGMHTNVGFLSENWFAFQLTQTLSDAVKTIQYRSFADTVRDGLLCFLTLWNYNGARALEAPRDSPTNPYSETALEDDRPDNLREIDGIADLGVLLFTYLLVDAVPRDEYMLPFQDGEITARHLLLYQLLAGAGMGLVGGFVGWTVAEIVAWAKDWSLLGQKMLQSVWSVWKNYWLALYRFKEGDTDEGRYNPRGGDYRGYPDHTTSPYRLPWANGEARVCGQGNQGIWSHNNSPDTSQVYAYDFGLDSGEPVLAARPGTVVDFFDWVPDDTDPPNAVGPPAGTTAPGTLTSQNNFILIRHDRDEAGNVVATPPGADHDRGANGAPVWTYGVYLHGRTNSVRGAFGNAAPAAILGQAVTRGQVIMLAGDTGRSFHNHLHMHVLPGPAAVAAAVPVPRGNLTRNSIPFVFCEVTNPSPFAPDGVCLARTYYTSGNDGSACT